MRLDLDDYRAEAETFVEAIEREYYLHLAGHKADLEIEPIYERHPALFDRAAVERLRGLAAEAAGDERRRRRRLLRFAFDGLVGRATRAEAIELARLEASLEVEGPDGPLAYRAVRAAQANEPDPERRAVLEESQQAILAERLNPLLLTVLERSHRLCGELGWPGYLAAHEDLCEFDLGRLAREAEDFLAATGDAHATLLEPRLAAAGLPPLGELRRADIPRLMRAPELDRHFADARMLDSLSATLAGLGIDLGAQANVTLDAGPRPTKSPRAFCSAVRMPDEIYLVVAPVGGFDDYQTLFHEAGHAEHFAHTDAALPFEYRLLGDNTVTESFAFLLDHLVSDPAWLYARLGLTDAGEVVAQADAVLLLFLRRYAAKLLYEVELHGGADIEAMPGRYAELVGGATGVEWPAASWLADVDEGFYVACYLRAWALETRWRVALRERFGERWFESADAGRWLRGLWRDGQRLSGDELAAEALGDELRLGVLAERYAR